MEVGAVLSNVTTSDEDKNSTEEIRFVLKGDDGNPILALVLFSFCLATILGNALVIAAVARERYLHTVTNYFITSLAVADCLVGSIVMPFSAAVEMQSDRQWLFGRDLCDVWHSFDVLASTASILNLCVISMDRYWAITDPFTYPGRMTPKRAACFIALVWVCSSLISFPAIAWWRAVAVVEDRPVVVEHCVFTDDIGYLVFSSTVSFYGPLSVMVFTYYRIYRAAVAQSRSLRLGIKQVAMSSTGESAKGGVGTAETMELLTLRIHRGGRVASDNRRCAAAAALLTYQAAGRHSLALKPSPTSARNNVLEIPETSEQAHQTIDRCHSPADAPIATLTVSSSVDGDGNGRLPIAKMNLSRKLAKIAKERKAAKTLGIVMGVFIACWLPFFVTNLLSAFCQSCIHNPERVVTVVTWLGWINSGMNPVIYACWSRDFRRAFARILCGCCPRLFHRWKRHSAKSGSNNTINQHLVGSNSRSHVTPSNSQLSQMTVSPSFTSLCHHSTSFPM
ncbi:dopamine receptor 2-like isoform X1 [Daphnia carinata]|uniref:dopamine receptor 2-like isoform X1 n=1 Tax=Daphnia carinata TaxID=120202 RepID=UPI002868B5DF|nr:dopamine receptor 2-like isoform X1 [Daphnia carinata]